MSPVPSADPIPRRCGRCGVRSTKRGSPKGGDDADLGLLKFTAEAAGYWVAPGGKIASAFSFVKAKVTGARYEADNETVELP